MDFIYFFILEGHRGRASPPESWLKGRGAAKSQYSWELSKGGELKRGVHRVYVQVCSTWEKKQDTRHQPLLYPSLAAGSTRGELRIDTRPRTDHGMARPQRTPHHSHVSTASSTSKARSSCSVASVWRRGAELSEDFINLTELHLSRVNLEGWFLPRTFRSKNLRVLD
jgi:hypothetical protein